MRICNFKKDRKLKLWNLYSQEYINHESPKCSVCGDSAIGDYYDKDWKQIRLCKNCYVNKTGMVNTIF